MIVSYAGLFIPETYAKETANWQAQALAQDLFDLFFLTPLLIFSSWFAYKKNKTALLIWGGTIVYIIYTFVLFCFSVRFNYLFIVYCIALGLSFYTFLFFLIEQFRNPIFSQFDESVPVKPVSYFLILLAGSFYLLWLSDIIRAYLNDAIPVSITEAGLITNPVHVLDLSVVLPGLIMIAVLLLKKKPLGLLLAPVALTLAILMDIAIGTMIIVMYLKDLTSDLSGAVMMAVLALITLFLLVWFLRRLNSKVN